PHAGRIQLIEQIRQERTAADLRQSLGAVVEHRAEAGSQSACQDSRRCVGQVTHVACGKAPPPLRKRRHAPMRFSASRSRDFWYSRDRTLALQYLASISRTAALLIEPFSMASNNCSTCVPS